MQRTSFSLFSLDLKCLLNESAQCLDFTDFDGTWQEGSLVLEIENPSGILCAIPRSEVTSSWSSEFSVTGGRRQDGAGAVRGNVNK